MKLYLPHSEKRESPSSEAMDSHDGIGKKGRKVDSRLTVSEENDQLKMKKKKEYHWHCKNEEKKQSKNRETQMVVDSRISRTESEETKKENTNNKKKMMMDRYRKMQCWVILKWFIIGRDGRAFKDPLLVDDNSDSGVLKNKNKNKNKKPIGLVDIETRLRKGFYSEPEQFADDIRLVLSHPLLYIPPNPRNEIQNFEVNWKSLKDKWKCEEDTKQKAGRTRSFLRGIELIK